MCIWLLTALNFRENRGPSFLHADSWAPTITVVPVSNRDNTRSVLNTRVLGMELQVYFVKFKFKICRKVVKIVFD